MNRSVFRAGLLALLTAAFCAAGSFAYAQGGQTLSGTVVDASGAVIPGADVAAKHVATGIVSNAVSNSEGLFSIPSLPIGTYTVTVSLQGFKTSVIQNVVLTAGAGANVKATMEIGGVSEQVTVSSSSEIIQTQTSGVSTTVNTNQITKLPLTTRSAMDFVNILPGVSSPNGNRNAVVNGLPRTAINITLDGVNIQDNTNKGSNGDDGFFAIVSPRLDAIEEVTVSSAGNGADAGGDGAVQIKFTTRSGTNNFSGSGYEYYRQRQAEREHLVQQPQRRHQAEAETEPDGLPRRRPDRASGLRRPQQGVLLRELRGAAPAGRHHPHPHHPEHQRPGRQLLLRRATASNVLALAAANGQLASVDPTIGKLLTDIRSATGTTGSVSTTDVNLDRYQYNIGVTSLRRFPTARVDYNITQKHRFNSSWNYNYFTDTPDTLNNLDPNFPGFPAQAGQNSVRMSWSNGLRSTLHAATWSTRRPSATPTTRSGSSTS